MATYDVHVFCDACSESHPRGVRVRLNDGPADKASLGDTYRGRDLPSNVVNMINNGIRCPNTRQEIQQRDNNQVFLVPIGD